MKEKLTREVLEDMAKCRERYCPDCKGVCMDYAEKSGIETLAMALLEEMDKPKDYVWKNAPEWADVAEVCWRDKANTKHKQLLNPLTRDLPKSRERQIAELFFEDEAYILACESAILKDREERESNR